MSKTTSADYSIEVRGSDETVAFAARELAQYLGKMLPSSSWARSEHVDFVVAEACDVSEAIRAAEVRDGKDRDQLFIRSHAGEVILAGNNPRSVLFAVYDFLERLGCRWLHPGPGGETIPTLKTIPMTGWKVNETASLRYRGVCVEGAFTPKHAKAFVDWMARKKMNHLYMQFEHGAFWYRRLVPGLKVSEAVKWDREIKTEVRKRGLILEWYGHGWNHNAIGKRVVGLDKAYKMPDKLRPFVAEVKGKREWYNHYPLETQLCLTHPQVRKKVFRLLERTIKRNPDVDILGFWLADGFNNQCECVRCRKFRMSELYADYLNEAAEIAHRLNPNLKIEALVYMTTLEAPKKVLVKNPYGNLILMLGPLCRCYRHRLFDPRCVYPGKISRFPALNKQPRLGLGNGDFTKYFADWRKRYSGDTYLFEYHMLILTWDFLSGNQPEMASRDIKDLAKQGLDGYVGCQNLRCFWPSGLGMQVIADTLWDVRKSYASIRQAHLHDWFGGAAAVAGRALDGMYRATSANDPYHERKPTEKEAAGSGKALATIAARLRGAAQKTPDTLIRRRLQFLADHADFLADQLVLLCSSSEALKEKAKDRLTSFFKRHAKDAEFLLDAQYHGKAYLLRKPARKMTGEA